MKRYEQFDHTGDVGVKVYGATWEELFANAAYALFDIIADLTQVEPKLERRVEVSGTDLEALLVKWLSELNFYFVTEQELFAQFDIQELTDTHLRAVARGEKIDPQRHEVYTEVKAVTYHQLDVKPVNGQWTAQIIFDL